VSTIQLHEMIPVETPLGFGYAFLIDSCEHDNYWTVGLENGAIVTFTQDKIRLSRSYTHGRGLDDETMNEVIGDD
jgi:hypothetical protein